MWILHACAMSHITDGLSDTGRLQMFLHNC